MSMTTNASGDGRSTEMNVTPLIDVLLVLLIIFMLMTPLNSTGMKTLVPQPQTEPSTAPPPPSEDVVLQVLPARDGTRPVLKLNQEEVSWEDLNARLQAVFARSPNRVMFVQGDTEVEFSSIADAIDVARGAGVQRIGLITAALDPQ